MTAVVVLADGRVAVCDEREWVSDAPGLAKQLNEGLADRPISGADPNPDLTEAQLAVERYGGAVTWFEQMEFDPDVDY